MDNDVRDEPNAESIITMYARAKARGENPKPPMFMRPRDDEDVRHFALRMLCALEGREPTDEELAEVAAEVERDADGGDI